MFPFDHLFETTTAIRLPRSNAINCFINNLFRMFPGFPGILLPCAVLARQDTRAMRLGMVNAGILRNLMWNMTSMTRNNITVAVGEL